MRVILSDEFALLSDSRHYSSFFYMRQRTSITCSVRWLVGWSVTHSFDDPHGAPYWPTWPCLQFCQFHMCTIQDQSRGKSFLERVLSNSQNQKKIDPFSIQILLGFVDSIFDSILLIYAKFPFI